MTYKLHCFAQSGNAYKAALYLELAGADWQPVFVNFFEGQHRSADYLEKNDMGQVPLLEHEGRSISQSAVILDYVSEREGKFRWANEDERLEVFRWLFWDNYSFTSIVAPLRFIGHFMPEDKRDPAVLGFLQSRLKGALKTLDQRLSGRDFVATPGLSIADLSICGYLYYGEELPFDLGAYPNIVAWLDRIKAMPGWKAPYDLMPKSA
ncbi:glutathione S-transferase family protein [Oceanicella actignis]|uniref:Glutathione S-transferase n=1 Tax=Oceanicella actignis TaxID=1189325 RepID=A0A1M7SV66_9RHOB|nr:glutathione S-transferase family protein [Oceanicella actignis]TYO90633.1 glutathione S-transferase [Oceanicella actignis]SES72170.1 glutathione S-transferase [Oceanicella actignis]SHN62352.1 glutathione S-transferase [Oceanicella actignis]